MTQTTNDPLGGLPGDRNDEDLVIVAERASEMEAAMLVTILKDAGISAVSVGEFTAGFRTEAPGMVQVKTFESDAAKAKVVLAGVKQVLDDDHG